MNHRTENLETHYFGNIQIMIQLLHGIYARFLFKYVPGGFVHRNSLTIVIRIIFTSMSLKQYNENHGELRSR